MANIEFTSSPLAVQPSAASLGNSAFRRAETGLYLHIPFCFHKCHYCDFYSIVDRPGGDDARQRRLTDALVRELHRWSPEASPDGPTGPIPEPTTIFVGGGTPTLLRPGLWDSLLCAMHDAGLSRRVREFTVEANPETVTPELMAVLAAGGVNRVSMGAQSFQPRLLDVLQRWHEPASVGRAMETVRGAEIDNVNLDLIFAIPGQTMDELDADLDATLALEPTHLSCYSLIFEPNTPLAMKRKLGRIAPVDEETERAMYEHVIRRLDDAGYEHYEISNWAKRTPASTPHPGPHTPNPNTCLHNLLYWSNGNWIGIGPGAASHVDGRRWKNVPHLGRYIAGSPHPPVQDDEQLDADARIGEQLMLGLRLRAGVSLDWLESTLPADDARRPMIDEFVAKDLLERTPTHLRLTYQGLFLADGIVGELL